MSIFRRIGLRLRAIFSRAQAPIVRPWVPEDAEPELRAAFEAARDMAATATTRGLGLVGIGVVEQRNSAGALLSAQPFRNLITDAGDLYVAQKVITGISPASPSAPTAASGMKLGTGSAAAAKNGTNSALGSYISGSNQAFDATYPSYTNLGAGLGVTAVYKTTYAAGTATNATINEAVIVNDAGTNATSLAANTYSRTVFSTVNKAAGDTLAITWSWLAKGA